MLAIFEFGRTAKGGCVSNAVIERAAVPVFVIVTVTIALVVLIGVGGKVIWVGETAITGCPTTLNAPERVACCPSEFVTVTS
jgi:hypothetical protein